MKKDLKRNWRGRLIMRPHAHQSRREDNKPSWAGWFYEDVDRKRRIARAKVWAQIRQDFIMRAGA